MAKRGLNIYKRKDGRWEGRYIKGRIDNKIKYGYVYAGTFNEVRRVLLNKLSSEAGQTKTEEKHNSRITFNAAAEGWLNALLPELKESSAVKYKNIINCYLKPSFGKLTLEDISTEKIKAFCGELLANGGTKGKGLSPKTVTCILSALKSIFKYAEKNGFLCMPDFDAVCVKQKPKPMKTLSILEQTKLNRYLCDKKSPTNVGILVCLYTGLRIGEVCALRWENIILDEQCIFIKETVQRLQTSDDEKNKTKLVISAPKSSCSLRTVPIPDGLYNILEDLKQSDECFLLSGSKKIVEPRTLQNRFKKVIKNCGIRNYNFHSLRHTFATRCVEKGADLKSLSEILGHASVNITLNRYVHPSMEMKLKNINLLSDLINVK